MKRYQGQPLQRNAAIAVVANDAIGNFVVTTPLLQMLQGAHRPAKIDYYSGSRTRELTESSDLIDGVFELYGPSPRDSAATLANAPKYDLVINVEWTPYAKSAAAILGSDGLVCGPAIGHGGRGDLPFPNDETGRLWEDREWIRETITDDYFFLDSGFIGEIFCRLAYLDGQVPRYKVPSVDPKGPIPDVLIATTASLSEKLWPLESWRTVLRSLQREQLSVGVLGAPPSVQKEHWRDGGIEENLIDDGLAVDLRGKLTLPEVVGAIEKSKLVLTLDNGIMHLAAATDTPTIGLFRHGIHRLWAPPASNIKVVTPGEERPVADISAETVADQLLQSLKAGENPSIN